MKKTLLQALLCLITGSAFCQDYIPFLDNNAWYVTVAGFGGSTDVWVEPQGNTTIDGNTYVSYTGVPMVGDILVREDVAARRVYRHVDGADELLYDFSLQVDDMIEMPGGVTYTVTSRDSVPSMSGRKRVRINLQGATQGGWDLNESWIEGVGTWAHPLRHFYEMPSDPATYIKCSFADGQPVYNTGLVNTGNPTPCEPPAAGSEDFTNSTITLSPNPLRDAALLTASFYFSKAELVMYNTLGQAVRRMNNLSGISVTIARNGLNAGLYFVQLVQDGKIIYSEKLVVAD